MRTVILDIGSLDQGLAAFGETWASGLPESSARISFASPELLWKVLSAKRWELLKAMTGKEAMSVRGAARLVGRDVKAVHSDIHALLVAGVLRKTDDGQVVFPFDTVHIDFMLKAA
ncbi:MAG TPA: DNA-binding protein [Telmatospirillum sp.]|nr:DNA-binding protein [Telmatospirillum sp.]